MENSAPSLKIFFPDVLLNCGNKNRRQNPVWEFTTTIIPFALAGYEVIITNSGSWNNCYIYHEKYVGMKSDRNKHTKNRYCTVGMGQYEENVFQNSFKYSCLQLSQIFVYLNKLFRCFCPCILLLQLNKGLRTIFTWGAVFVLSMALCQACFVCLSFLCLNYNDYTHKTKVFSVYTRISTCPKFKAFVETYTN